MAPEYLKPVTLPLARPTMSHRFGPTLFLPPFPVVWQALHFLNVLVPAPTSAAARRAITSTAGSATAPPSAFFAGEPAVVAACTGAGPFGTRASPIMSAPNSNHVTMRTDAPSFSHQLKCM